MSITRRRSYEEFMRNKARKSLKFSDSEVILAKKYLKNPTNAGLWRLEARWSFDSPIAKEINDIITEEVPKLKVNNRRISVDENEMDSLLTRTESISFYLRLFARLVRLKDDPETLSDYIDQDDEDGIIMSLLDLKKISTTYAAALVHFEKKLYTPNHDLRVGKVWLTRLKDGSFICVTSPKDLEDSYSKRGDGPRYLEDETVRGKKKIELISLTSETLKNISIFFQKLELITEIDQYAFFSPEEEILSPYVDILQKMLSDIFPRKSDSQFFHKMIGDYQDGNHTGCIGTAGIIVEGCLTQIYETIYRTPVPRKMTLGSLQQKIAEVAKSKNTKELDRQTVVQLMQQYKEDNKTDAVKLTDLDSKLLLKYFEERFKKLEVKIESDDFFPAIIKMNLEDVIRFRNATSHKSLDPVGSFEALKSIYCSFSIVTWWDEGKRKIDWNQGQEGVIKQFVAAAKNYKS